MCGICGTFKSRGSASSEEMLHAVKAMSLKMAHRGPDDEGVWRDERCALGFRRLAILDLSPNGHQPMESADGEYILVFNGEVYNYLEIRTRLEAKGVKFRSSGDAEVVLYALAEWGLQALELFNGMFALGFYDRTNQKLLLARDHAGIKPLYYLTAKEGIVFASQYDQVIQHPWAHQLQVSQSALSMYLRFGHTPAPFGLVDQTHLLQAGSWLTVDRDGHIKQGKYFEFPAEQSPQLRGDNAYEAFDEAFSRAVKRHLISDVPVGVFLSGGIDSPLVAAEAVLHSDVQLKAFTIGVDDPDMDESHDAALYARELKLNHILNKVDGGEALKLLDDVVKACTEPTADFSIFPTLMVSKLASQQVKVVLSGDGGDELFWGYPARFGAVLDQAPYYRLPGLLRYGAIAARKFLGAGLATRDVLWRTTGRYYQKKHTILLEHDLSQLFPDLKPLPSNFAIFDYSDTDVDALAYKLRWSEFQLHLANILSKVDRASMFHSLEVRVPLLDKEVIDVALKTDWQSCLNLKSREGKIPLRRALRKRLTHHTTAKKGFTVPMHDWLTGPLQPLLMDMVIEKDDFLGQPIRKGYLKKMNQYLLNGDRSRAWGLWMLLSLALWEQSHFQRA